MILKQVITWAKEHPGKLFLIDGSGAMLSAFLLGVVLVELESVFGIPRPALYFLAIFPCIFAVFDFYCYRTKSKNVGEFLMGIAVFNIAYSILSIGLTIYYFQEITYLGLSYIAVEILIVITLAALELKVAGSLILKRQVSEIDK